MSYILEKEKIVHVFVCAWQLFVTVTKYPKQSTMRKDFFELTTVEVLSALLL